MSFLLPLLSRGASLFSSLFSKGSGIIKNLTSGGSLFSNLAGGASKIISKAGNIATKIGKGVEIAKPFISTVKKGIEGVKDALAGKVAKAESKAEPSKTLTDDDVLSKTNMTSVLPTTTSQTTSVTPVTQAQAAPQQNKLTSFNRNTFQV